MAFDLLYGTIVGFGGPMVVAFTIQGGTGSQSSVAQYAQAIPRSFGGSLVSTDHTVELAGGRYTHYFWVRNETAGNIYFSLRGGRFS